MEKPKNRWVGDFACICTKWPRILSYIFPIECFFGRNDVYFCDGLFPHTFYKSKRVCLVHDLMVKIYPANYSLVKRIYLNCFFRNLPKADLIICVSENTKKDIVKYYGISKDKVVVCNNGVDVLPEVSPCVLENKNTQIKHRFLFYLGDMRPNKNLVNTVKGFLTFCSEHKVDDLFFYIAGKKNGDYEKIRGIVETSDYGQQIVFLDYISDNDKFLLYENAEAVMLISFYEGFGMPVIEAMQHYKPVITSNCSSMKEVGGNAAILVNPECIDEIAKAIADVYYGKYTIDREAYRIKLEKYSFENVARIVKNVIEDMVN